MNYRLTSILTLGVVLAAALTARTEEPAAKKPLGTWQREVDGNKVTFHFTADHLVTKIGGGATIVVHSDYGVTKDRVVFGICTEVDNGGGQGPSVGDLFSFRIVVGKDKLTLSELKMAGKPAEGDSKRTIEGEYEFVVPEKK